jgi:hypothetical protein
MGSNNLVEWVDTEPTQFTTKYFTKFKWQIGKCKWTRSKSIPITKRSIIMKHNMTMILMQRIDLVLIQMTHMPSICFQAIKTSSICMGLKETPEVKPTTQIGRLELVQISWDSVKTLIKDHFSKLNG